VPGIFPPVAMGSALESFATAIRRRLPQRFGGSERGKAPVTAARYHAVDGGVFDNQGIQALIEQSCTGIIVSDAAAPLLPARRFRIQRQIWLLKRSQEIIFSRVRELGYSQLRLLAHVNRLLDELREAGASSQKLTALRDPDSPPVTAYCAVELSVLKETDSQLPSSLRELVGSMRTDLDAFSAYELSALMFHGYTTADFALQEHRAIFSLTDQPVRFETKLAELNIDWTKLDKRDVVRALNHLRASRVQFAAWRHFRRAVGALAIWISEQEWLVAIKNGIVEAWRNVSPTWKWVQAGTITIESADGKRDEKPIYVWRRRHLLRSLWRWIQQTWHRIGGGERRDG
jgi:hypothetical protein